MRKSKPKAEPKSIIEINEECFGGDKTRDYLKHDFVRVVEGVIQREIICTLLKEINSERTASRHYIHDSVDILNSIKTNHELGTMVNVRLLLNNNETGAGGTFVQHVTKLNTKYFIEHYRDANKIPFVLTKAFSEDRKSNTYLTVDKFLDSHNDEINRLIETLIKLAKNFNKRGYSSDIVKNYETSYFHKDKQIKEKKAKYDVITEARVIEGLNVIDHKRHASVSFDPYKIANALNDLAQIVDMYQGLVCESIGFNGPVISLEEYVEQVFALFSKQVSSVTKQCAIENTVKYLRPTLNVLTWGGKKNW